MKKIKWDECQFPPSATKRMKRGDAQGAYPPDQCNPGMNVKAKYKGVNIELEIKEELTIEQPRSYKAIISSYISHKQKEILGFSKGDEVEIEHKFICHFKQ